MQRLSGLDASFLYMETPTSYMHVAGLMVLDPSTVPDGFSIQNIREFYEQRLHLAAPFRRRLVEIPLGIHHPLWIEDPDFDLDQHLHHIAVPPPGGSSELCALAADLVEDAARPPPSTLGVLDHRRPRRRQRRRAHEGPPRRDRRRVGQRDHSSRSST